jgi:hypothetical protein
MEAQLGWRQLEDQPTAVGIDIRKAEDIAEKRPGALRVFGIDD